MRVVGALVAGMFAGLLVAVTLGWSAPVLALAGAVGGVMIERRTR